LNLSYEYLQELSLCIGADVPFLLSDFGTAIANGIGEKLTPIKLKTVLWLLVVYPNINISTKWAYNSFDKYKLLTKNKKNIKVINYINDIEDVVSLLFNDFEAIVFPRYPEIKTLKKKMEQNGAAGSLMSGSGSSVFGIFSTKEDAEKALCQHSAHKAFIVHSV